MKNKQLILSNVTELQNSELNSINGGFIALYVSAVTWAICTYYETKAAIETLKNMR